MAGIGVAVMRGDLERKLAAETENFNRQTRDYTRTLDALGGRVTADPCSDTHLKWLRQIAFLPDGIHEIMYAPGGHIRCTVSAGSLDDAIPLGNPDFSLAPNGDGRMWLDRDLTALGFEGMTGTLLGVNDYIVVVPPPGLSTPMTGWIDYQIVYRGEDGRIWHRLGSRDLYSAVSGAIDAEPWNMPTPHGFAVFGCNELQTSCIALTAPIAPVIRNSSAQIVGAVIFAALIAGFATLLTRGLLERIWSLPHRFRRRLSAETVECHYQPLLDLHEDRIAGIEVLARWRDDDGTLIYPDTFLPIIEERRLHRTFTRHVVNRAFDDLCSFPAGPTPLLVHFNIFPGEFSVDWMLALFEGFLADSRFTVVVELVESDLLPIERTRAAIEQLREAGILTFIDDFGEGYSSIAYLAGLGTYGVKLDRSFGLAPEGSLMDAMLSSAVDMVAKTGQMLVVEGVETATRLASLKANNKVDMAQGYFISRPIEIGALRTLLTVRDFWPASKAA